jgi:hypothetical protein
VGQSEAVLHDLRSRDVSLERDVFLRTLVRELAGTLQDVVGLEEASGYVSVVGQRVGDQINSEYKQALKVEHLDRGQVAAVLADLKRRIKGEFRVVEETPEKIVFRNTASSPPRTWATARWS